MHELSIVMGIVAIAEEYISKEALAVIDEIELDIGSLSGIEAESFEFAWKQAVKETILQHTTKKINHIPGIARCLDCESEFEISHYYDPCPHCGQHLLQILQGKEMSVKSLLIS